MNLLPKTHEEFSQKEYWNSFFKKRGSKAFEWYGEYPELCGLVHKYIKPKDVILVVGCGNSTLSCDLYDVGYRNITNIDISHVVIRQMQEGHGSSRPDMKFLQMDATETSFEDGQFSVVLDKGTLDALMPDDSPDVRHKIHKLFDEVDRVLRVGGRYVCVSLLQEHVLLELLDYFPKAGWMVRVCRCVEAENKAVESGEGPGLPVFVIICTKFKKLPNFQQVLEICLAGDQIKRVESAADVVESIKSLQQSAMVCTRLSRGSVADHGEVVMELYRPSEDTSRYTIHVLDQPYARESSRRYAAFIVPQGRENEWLFATTEGRTTLLKSTGYDRLAVVTLHREHTYSGLKAVQTELEECIIKLSPPGSRKMKTPFLSVGSDVGHREVCYRGFSQMSGEFVIEEAEGDGGQLFRRLIFLSNQGTVQSEARLKILKSRKGKPKKVVDLGYLASDYLVYMTVGVSLGVAENSKSHVLVIGLGGGGLCSFIQHCFQKVRVTAVDIDPVMLDMATTYFGLVQDERLDVYIRDGVQYVLQAAEKGNTFSVILFDVDSKDPSLGMSCPPRQFLESSVLQAVKTCIGDQGFFVVNLVCRNKDMREEAVDALKAAFESVSSYKLEQEVSEIVFCSGLKLSSQPEWRELLEAAASRVNALAKRRKLQVGNLLDVDGLLGSFKVLT